MRPSQLPQETYLPTSCVRPTRAWPRASWWLRPRGPCRAHHHITPKRSPARGRSDWWKTGKQLVSAAGKRKSTSNVWKTVWLCWKTKTRPWLKSWKHWRTFTATKLSSGGCLWSRAKNSTGYKLLQRNKKKRLRNKNCFDRIRFSAHSGLVFCAEFRSVPVKFEQLELASFALVLILWSLHVKTQVSYTPCLLLLLCTGVASQWAPAEDEEQEEEMQVLPENVPLKCRVHEKNTHKKKNPLAGQSGLTTSKFLWGQTRCTQSYAGPTGSATRQLNRVYLIKSSGSFTLPFLVVSCIPPCENTIKYLQTFCQWNDFLDFISLYRSEWTQDENPLIVRRPSKDTWSLCMDLNQCSARGSPKEPLFFKTKVSWM